MFVCVLAGEVGAHPPGALSSAGDQKGGDGKEKLEWGSQCSEQGVLSVGEMYYLPCVLSSVCCELLHHHHQNMNTMTAMAAVTVEVNYRALAVTSPCANTAHGPESSSSQQINMPNQCS